MELWFLTCDSAIGGLLSDLALLVWHGATLEVNLIPPPSKMICTLHSVFSNWLKWLLDSGKPIRKPMMWLGGTVGLLAGHCLATQNSAFRLLGWRNNEAERRRLNHPVPLATSGDKQWILFLPLPSLLLCSAARSYAPWCIYCLSRAVRMHGHHKDIHNKRSSKLNRGGLLFIIFWIGQQNDLYLFSNLQHQQQEEASSQRRTVPDIWWQEVGGAAPLFGHSRTCWSQPSHLGRLSAPTDLQDELSPGDEWRCQKKTPSLKKRTPSLLHSIHPSPPPGVLQQWGYAATSLPSH